MVNLLQEFLFCGILLYFIFAVMGFELGLALAKAGTLPLEVLCQPCGIL
jgi:hypothetical protein